MAVQRKELYLGVLQGQEGINKCKLSPKKQGAFDMGLRVSHTYVMTSMQEAFT